MSNDIGWVDGALSILSKCKNQDGLEFICNVDILNIYYRNGVRYIQEGITMDQNSSIEWELSEYDRKRILDGEELLGPLSNDQCWTIVVNRNEQNIILSKWPQMIRVIGVRIKALLYFKEFSGPYQTDDFSSFRLNGIWDWVKWKKVFLTRTPIPIRIKVHFEIATICNVDGIISDKNVWTEYGIDCD